MIVADIEAMVRETPFSYLDECRNIAPFKAFELEWIIQAPEKLVRFN